MGDAVLAHFGAPIAHEDDALRAVRAGLDIQAAARGYCETVRARQGIDFRLRVCINSGNAVLAFVGDAIRAEYTAMGDAANVAARLQSAVELGSVLISADTHALVRGQVGCDLAKPCKAQKLATFQALADVGITPADAFRGRLWSLRGVLWTTGPRARLDCRQDTFRRW